MREPKKYVLKKVKQKGYYRNIIKNGKIIGKSWIKPNKVRRKVVSKTWIKWREEEDAKIVRAEFDKILKEQIKRWRTGWLRAEFRDSKTGHKFYYKEVLTFEQFVNMRKREERIDSISKSKKATEMRSEKARITKLGYRIKFKSDKQAIQEARKLLEIAKWKAERIKMSREFRDWENRFLNVK